MVIYTGADYPGNDERRFVHDQSYHLTVSEELPEDRYIESNDTTPYRSIRK
jgi:hypothetical protein